MLIVGRSESLQRTQREQGGGETDALSGLAEAGRLQLAQVQLEHFSTELILPRFQHSKIPFTILCTVDILSNLSVCYLSLSICVHTRYIFFFYLQNNLLCLCSLCVCVFLIKKKERVD